MRSEKVLDLISALAIGDFFKADLRDATVVTLYLLTQVNGYLGPRMASQLAKSTRLVALD